MVLDREEEAKRMMNGMNQNYGQDMGGYNQGYGGMGGYEPQS